MICLLSTTVSLILLPLRLIIINCLRLNLDSGFWLPSTVRTQINGLCARTLELPLLVRSAVFFLSHEVDF